MKKFLVLAVFLAATLALAQDRPAVNAPANSVYVGADGRFEADPDTAVLSFTISPQADTANEAYAQASKAAEQVRAILRQNGIDPKLAQLGFMSVQPMYDWKNPKHKVVAYRLSTTITVKLKKPEFDKIGPLTGQFADIDTVSGQSLNYELNDMEAAKNKAVEDAFKKARNSASTVTTAGGRQLGELLYASVDVNEPVRIYAPQAMQMKSMAAAAPAPTEGFSAQQITVTAHVNALFGMK
ncbi:MAG TPA: SIMPL domain-containing protein [Terriglobales bacterium]|nr:SIMPL domain-containing protein [Terriglobales bacterium]